MTIALIEAPRFGLDHLVRAAGERGHDLVLLTRDRTRYAYETSRLTADALRVLDVDTADVTSMVSALGDVPGLAGIVRSTDRQSLSAIAVAQRLGLPHQDRDAVALLRDKGRLRRHLHERGFARFGSLVFDPRTTRADRLSERLSYPVVVKDVAGTGSEHVWLVRGPDELTLAIAEATAPNGLTRAGRLTAEPYLNGPLYSAETVSWNGETRVLGITSRVLSAEPHFREEGGSFPVVFPPPAMARLSSWVSAILASTGYDAGISHTEFIVTADGPEIVEINSRLGGAFIGLGINRSLRVNVHGALLDLALGRRPEVLDAEITAVGGLAQVGLFAPHPGIFNGIDGAEALATHPGGPWLYLARRPGDRVLSARGQRAVVAGVVAEGPTAELALHNANSATRRLRVLMDPGVPESAS